MQTLGYILLCLIAPVVWGVFSSWIFDRFVSGKGKAATPDQSSATGWDTYEI